ncbi:MAG TPA: hypothetical protein VLX44_06870 [Xanthobacteraceae bacterium]|nr:hypothetical protein [Xanthobacteraceae bacterium]
MMVILRFIRYVRAIALATVATATLVHADPLKVVDVAAPAVNCVFEPNCAVVVSDTTGSVPLAFEAGKPFLQSRTFVGAKGTPAAGLTGYEYRVDLTSAAGAVECLLGLVVNFGPVQTLDYAANTPAQVYVVKDGGLGSVGIKSAEKDGDVITFTFEKPLCVGNSPGHGASTFFFGLASKKPPHTIQAGMWGYGNPAFMALDARAPDH